MPPIFSQFAKYANINYGFSDRNDGSMHRHLEKSNRDKYFRKIDISPNRVVIADLTHGVKVVKVSDEAAGKMVAGVDGLITDTKNLFLSATAADCFLLYFYDPIKVVVGIAHVGWRGLLSGVVKNAINAIVINFGSALQDLLVGIGPGIQKCHFEISSEDRTKYEKYSDFVFERGNRVFVDLSGIIKLQLQEGGVEKRHIETSDLCTYCNENKYFSYRRDKPKEVQPMVGYIGLK